MGTISSRAKNIAPFRVMTVVEQAFALSEQGHDVLHLEIGEPDFSISAASSEQNQPPGKLGYSAALGLLPLREAIAAHYLRRYHVSVEPSRIAITTGGSGALQLLSALLIEPGKGVMLPDPCYPCNRQFVQLMGGEVQNVVHDAQLSYFSAQQAQRHWQANTAALMLATPENPTGAVIPRQEMAAFVDLAVQNQAALIVDEIYQGLVYGDADDYTALELSEDVFVVNSFSKFFGMTGWRLGWLVAPEWAMPYIERLAQNLFICAPTATQHAALAAFNQNTFALLERRKVVYSQRRDYLLGQLQQLGLQVKSPPQGAFYIYGDISAWSDNSENFAQQLLQQKYLATTPGVDFSPSCGHKTLRFAYTADMAQLQDAVRRLAAFV